MPKRREANKVIADKARSKTPLRLRIIRLSLFFLVVAYLAFSPLTWASILEFQPVKYPCTEYGCTEVLGVKREEALFQTPSGQTLHGWFFRKPGAHYTMLIHHGQTGNLAISLGLVATLLYCGNSAFIYDYEGYGRSTGSPSNAALCADGEVAFDYLVHTLHVEPANIVEYGVSLGSGVASHVATVRPCAAVILVSPYKSLIEVSREFMPFLKLYPNFLFPRPDLGANEFIKSNRTIPLLLIHGQLDPIIRVHHAQELYAMASCPKKLVIEPHVHHGDFSTLFLAKQITSFLGSIARGNHSSLD